jgi:hypothetical protein
MKYRLLAALFVMSVSPAMAQQTNTQPTVAAPVLITAGLTFQQVLPVVQSNGRHSVTIENNNATDKCNVIIVGVGSPWLVGDTTATSRTVNGTSMTAAQASMTLAAGQVYSRYYPYIPSDQFLATCTTTGDSLYVDTQ